MKSATTNRIIAMAAIIATNSVEIDGLTEPEGADGFAVGIGEIVPYPMGMYCSLIFDTLEVPYSTYFPVSS